MGENHEEINYHNKKYTKITLSDFIRKTYTIILFVLDQEPRNILAVEVLVKNNYQDKIEIKNGLYLIH